ncbi:MAG: hypothetical protein J2P55_13355 [Rhizobiales bacterium]|nr:hypothetical protein [Hyphomicrobiales bacterium]
MKVATMENEHLKFVELLKVNDEILREIIQCGSARFALIVWCDCLDEPTHSASNDDDSKRISKMLRTSADMLDNAEEHRISGHA